MIAFSLILLVLLGIIFHWKQFKKTSYVFYFLTALLFFSIGSGWMANDLLRQQLAYSSTPQTSWGKKNIIVVLGTGVENIPKANQFEPTMFAYGRIVKAMEVYHACKKKSERCIVLVSGGDPKKRGESEAAVYGSVLNKLGLPASDLTLESKSNNTWQNAEFSDEIIRKINPDKVILVTSGFHMRRSLLYFSHFGETPTPIRADYLSAFNTLLPNFYNFTLTELALSERIGIARYYVYNYLGWNKAKVVISR